ncbi:MAG: hypothetical protein P8R36_04465 [Actinomycetota bacterium]|nr:hypothetical protein [Actinomycetota bacterium]MDG1489520.1 hypothetical protein [Actinomycetota bacterium]MDG2121220.1 hypothetical protein [Actinomycetota bacterium]
MLGVAYAVVRSEPPEVFLATDVEVLHRVLAAELVARAASGTFDMNELTELREALLEERWGDAVSRWIACSGIEVDVYTHLHVYSSEDLPPDLIGAQIQFSPLFQEQSFKQITG